MKGSFLKKVLSLGIAMFTAVASFVITPDIMPEGVPGKVYAAPNGVSRVSVHDPSIVKGNDGYYYIFGSHLAFARSKDLSNWSYIKNNVSTDYKNLFKVGANWAAYSNSSYSVDTNIWAPDVIFNPNMNKWCMYMSINGRDFNSSIALLTADNINGPYKYVDTIVYSGFDKSRHPVSKTDYYKVCGQNASIDRYLVNGNWNLQYGTNAIDPNVFFDVNGQLHMVYGSWFGGLFILDLDEKTGLRDYSVKYALDTDASDGKASDPYLGGRIAGGKGASGEAPYIKHIGDYYYLFTTYGGLSADGGYNMRVFRSKRLYGPYVDKAGNYATYMNPVGENNTSGNIGVRLMSYYKWSCNDVAQVAQGHNSVYSEGGKNYLVYHTRFNNGSEYHEVRVHQLYMTEDGWLAAAPYEYQGETISGNGYSKNEIAGTYEFLRHDVTCSRLNKIAGTSTITLTSDGKITGAVNGTWSTTANTPYVTMDIDGMRYRGVFSKQYDESNSRKEVMTFSVIGKNNLTLWGSKNGNAPAAQNPSTPTTKPSYKEANVKEGIYFIKNKLSGLYLDVENGSSEDGANIRQWSGNGDKAQAFKIESAGNGYYYLKTGASNYKSCLDVYEGSAENGANITQWNCWNGQMQQFKIVENTDDTYSFLSRASSDVRALDVYENSKEAGANIDQWEYWGGDGQKFTLENFDSLQGDYYIKSTYSNLYLDVENGSSENGANVRQWSGNGAMAQRFRLVPDGQGYYYIMTGATNYKSCLDVSGAKATDGASIIQYAYKGGDNQKFKIEKQSNGRYVIYTKASSNKSAFDVYEMSKDAGADVCQWEFWNGEGQMWKLEKL